MTLIVVLNNTIHVDSRIVVGDNNGVATKIRESKFGKWTSAGDADTASQAMQRMESENNMFILHDGEDPEHTCLFLRHNVDSKIYGLYLGSKKPIMVEVQVPAKTGIQCMAGSGWRMWHAYFLEHNELSKAFELTARFHRDVEGPFEYF